MHLRLATTKDATAIATIYNQGIEDRVATFETRLRSPQEIEQWFDGVHPIVVLESDQQQVIAFASTSVYRPRPCSDGSASARWGSTKSTRNSTACGGTWSLSSGSWKPVSPRSEEAAPSLTCVFFFRSVLLRPFG